MEQWYFIYVVHENLPGRDCSSCTVLSRFAWYDLYVYVQCILHTVQLYICSKARPVQKTPVQYEFNYIRIDWSYAIFTLNITYIKLLCFSLFFIYHDLYFICIIWTNLFTIHFRSRMGIFPPVLVLLIKVEERKQGKWRLERKKLKFYKTFEFAFENLHKNKLANGKLFDLSV